jgi:hypothetical protein
MPDPFELPEDLFDGEPDLFLGDSLIPLYDDLSQQDQDYHGDTWRDDL